MLLNKLGTNPNNDIKDFTWKSPPDLAHYFQRFSSKVLWHFTGYGGKSLEEAFDRLVSICKDGINATYVPKITMPSGNEREGLPVACMCDIPFRDLGIHVIRYGDFGIACYKERAIENHFNPVLYVHHAHHLLKQAEELIEKAESLSSSNPELMKTLDSYNFLLGSVVKGSDLKAPFDWTFKGAESSSHNFYYEREWRSTTGWKLQNGDVAAIMMPEFYIEQFKKAMGSEANGEWLLKRPIIPVEMIVDL